MAYFGMVTKHHVDDALRPVFNAGFWRVTETGNLSSLVCACCAKCILTTLVTSCGSAPGRAHVKALNLKKKMVGTRRLELLTSTVSILRR